MKTGKGPYMQKAGRGNMPKTGGNERMQPLMVKGPYMDHEGKGTDTDPPSHTTYSQRTNPDTGNITGMTRTSPSGETTSLSYPDNETIKSAQKQVNNLSDVSSFSKRHTRDKNNIILVDGKPRTDFTNTQYNMDSGSTQQFIRSKGLDPKNINQNVVKKTFPEVFNRLQQGFVKDSTMQSNKNLSYNSLIRTTAEIPQRTELNGANMFKKK